MMSRSAPILLLLCATLATPAPAQQPTTAVRSDEERTAAHFATLRGDPVRLRMFLQAMPKGGDIHSHLSGSIYAETFIDWAVADSLCIIVADGSFGAPPCDADTGRPPAAHALRDPSLYSLVIDGMSMRNWHPSQRSGHAQFFDSFVKYRLVAVQRTGPMLAEVAARAAAGNVSYLELMLTPDAARVNAVGRAAGWVPDLERMRDNLLRAGMRDTVQALRRILDDALTEQRAALTCDVAAQRPPATAVDGCNVLIRFLYQVPRAQPPELVFAGILAGFELATADPRVVGLNLVQPEDNYVAMRDYMLHMQMIEALRRHYPTVPVTLHAGELRAGLVPPEGLRFHIGAAVRVAGARRIGHGASIAHEPDADALLVEMAQRRVLVEIALGSNDAILGVRGAEHPLRTYLRAGVPVALVTDDEGILRSDLTGEFLKAALEHDLDYITLRTMVRNSLEHAFIEGESLWSDPALFRPVAACADLEVAACRAFLGRSPRATLQARLEADLRRFESRTR